MIDAPGSALWQLEAALPHGLSADHGRLDAYLVWDLLTNFQRHAGAPGAAAAPGAGRWLPLVLELAEPAARALEALAQADETGPQLAAQLSRWAGPTGLSSIQTAIVPERLIPLLARGVAQGWLQRFQLGAPCDAPLEAALEPPPGLPDWLPPGPLHTLGVIDDGCCLAHQDFRGAQGQSRLLWLWDQAPGAAPGAHWRRYGVADPGPGFGVAYGMELSNPSVVKLLADPATGRLGEAGERALYAAIERPDWGPPDHSHGARVMHLLAGPSASQRLAAAAESGYATGSDTEARPADSLAEQLPLIFVQLPAQTLADSSGDSMAMHVIDAARYIVGRTRDRAPPKDGWRSTLNISLGGIAGPHDGTSLAEVVLDELAADARVQVVGSAGNAADRQRVHAQRSVSRDEPGDFFIDLPAGQTQDSFIEWWLPDAGPDTEGWQFSVTPPGGLAAPVPAGAGQVLTLRRGDTAPLASLVFARQVAQGLHGTLVLLALAPTTLPVSSAASPAAKRAAYGTGAGAAAGAGAGPRATAPAGVWTVQVRGRSAEPVEVHAWVERDDVLVGARQPQRTRFELDPRQPRDAQYVNDHFTLSTLAQGQRVVAAGASVLSSNAAAPYSSRGPCRGGPQRDPVLHYAPGDRSPSQPGVRVAGFYSGQMSAIGGTSAAAPQVARRLVDTGSPAAADAASMTDPDGHPLTGPPAGAARAR